jgi:nitrogen-specific signal transduction histidine kinase
MSKSSTPLKTSLEEIAVPFPRVTGLVRQLTHDVRNGLNNIDLQSAYLQELVTDPQAVTEMKRLRQMVGDAARMLKDFSARFWLSTPNFVKYTARMFIEDFRQRLAKLPPEDIPAVEWTVSLREEAISVDLEMISRCLMEYFRNGQQFREQDRPMEARVRARDRRLTLELVETKSSVPSPPETWGLEPLVSTRRGGFGMGLFYARQVLEGHGGEVVAIFDSEAKQLTTRLSLPIVGS